MGSQHNRNSLTSSREPIRDAKEVSFIQGLKTDIKTVKYLDLTSGISMSAEAEFSLAVRSGELEVREAGGVSHLAIGSDKRISQHLSNFPPEIDQG
jgi:hypothetical protein